jgi:transposase-like protein
MILGERRSEMVVCKDCGQLYKQSIKTTQGKRANAKVKRTGLCGLKANTGRRDIEEERVCQDFTTETIDNLFR